MFLRIDRLQIELPQPKDASPDVPDLPPVPETVAPGFDPAELPAIAKTLFG
jgi:hypothetical protein